MTSVNPYQEIDKLKGTRYKVGSAPTVAAALAEAHVTRRPDDAYTKDLQGKRVILENPAIESRHSKSLKEKKARRELAERRRKNGVAGRNEAKRKGFWKPERDIARYSLFTPIHSLWCAYMAELFNLREAPTGNAMYEPPTHLPASTTMHGKLVKADLHGAIVTVKQSKNLDLVGVGGIVVHETENTFKVVTQDDKFKMIPKRHSIFVLRIPVYAPAANDERDGTNVGRSPLDTSPCLEFDLYGNQFCFRSTDRATRKFKHKETLELI